MEATRCALAFAPFALAAVAVHLSSDVDRAMSSLQALQLTIASALALSLVAIFAVATALEEHRERTETLLTWQITTRAVVVAAGIKLVLTLALYLGFTGEFLGGPEYWRPRLDQPLSWVHAALVAGVVAVVAVVSRFRPLEGGRFALRLLTLASLLGVMQVATLVAFIGVTTVAVVRPSADATALFSLPMWVIEHVELVQLGGVMLILAFGIWSARHRPPLTTGNYLWLVAGLWLGPPLAGIALSEGGGPTAWAAPGQVETLLTVAVLALALLPAGRRLSRRALMVLLVVPIVVLHLDTLLPDSWVQSMTQLLVVAATATALWLSPPPVYADRGRNERVRMLLMARVLIILLLSVYLFTEEEFSGQVSAATTLAWLWLGVPLTAVLTARVSAADGLNGKVR